MVNCTAATEDFFPMLGVKPFMGSLYTPREYTYLANDTVVVSYRFWKDKLGGDPHVLGRVLHFEEDSQTVIGVLPPMPDLFPETDVWAKLTTRPGWDFMKWRNNKFLTVMGRLRPDASPLAAQQVRPGNPGLAPGRAAELRLVPDSAERFGCRKCADATAHPHGRGSRSFVDCLCQRGCSLAFARHQTGPGDGGAARRRRHPNPHGSAVRH